MLERGRKPQRGPEARACFFLLAAILLLGFLVPAPVRGDAPGVQDNGNASRTIFWNMTGPSGFSALDNVTLQDGNATLPWQSASVAWDHAADFRANGALGSGMVANSTGIYLWGNDSNSVAAGEFNDSGLPWRYLSGSPGTVNASWNATQGDAQLGHVGASTESLWDGMDTNVTTNWYPSPAIAVLIENESGMKQGTGMMGIDVAGSWTSNYLGITNLSSASVPLNWTGFDRMTLWIEVNASLSIGFNVTAVLSNGVQVGTTNQTLARGWQELSVDLGELGNASARAALKQVTLRFNARAVPIGTWFHIDDVRLGLAKDFQGRASVSQGVNKTVQTTPLPGSALLSFDWRIANATGVSGYVASANITSPSAPAYGMTLDAGGSAAWEHAALDVSAATAPADRYNLSFQLFVEANTTAPTSVTMFVDNVSLVFPGRQNATYLSNATSLGTNSAYLNLSWSALILNDTSVTFGIRTGSTPTPKPGTWSDWENFTATGTCPLSVPGAMYFQIQAQLRTSNASRTPVLQSFELNTRHHLSSGVIQSTVYPALGDFLDWSSFNASIVEPRLTSVEFSVWNGTEWIQVTPGSGLSFVHVSTMRWRVALTSSDGLATPSVHDVQVTYEYLGRPVRLTVSLRGSVVNPVETLTVSTGQYTPFTAAVYDAGNHLIPSGLAPLTWSTNDTKGTAFQNGTYLAGSPGVYSVNVTVTGYQLVVSINVRVTGASTLPVASSLWNLWPAYVVASVAAAGFAVYELVIRRMFAIDDVFLIAKDGRLILHNTRRMRADRDEDILSGMLTAIMAFLRDQDPEENGELRSFKVGGKTTLLERGQHVYLTAVYSGRVPRWAGKDLHRFMVDLEERFGDAFTQWSGSPEDLHGLKDYMGRFVSRVRYHADRSSVEPTG